MKLYLNIDRQHDDYSTIEDAWVTFVRRYDEDRDYLGFILQIVLPAYVWTKIDYGNAECWGQTAIYISNIDSYGYKWNRSFRYWTDVFVRKNTPRYPISREFPHG